MIDRSFWRRRHTGSIKKAWLNKQNNKIEKNSVMIYFLLKKRLLGKNIFKSYNASLVSALLKLRESCFVICEWRDIILESI